MSESAVDMAELSNAITDSMYKAYERRLLKDIKKWPVPKHVAIIMDGNRRYAEELGLQPTDGHDMGRDKLEQVLEWCMEVDIRVLTVYAFSTENIKRSMDEVEKLMELFDINFRKAADDERIHKNKVRIRAIGQVDKLPPTVQEAIKYAEERTKNYDAYHFNLAVAYGGREEIIHAIKRIAEDHKSGKLDLGDIDEKKVSSYMFTKDLPDPDLVLRTSGEERISNFLLWQMAYAELYFTDVYWPGFRKIDFLRAVRTYQSRHRRYGK